MHMVYEYKNKNHDYSIMYYELLDACHIIQVYCNFLIVITKNQKEELCTVNCAGIHQCLNYEQIISSYIYGI